MRNNTEIVRFCRIQAPIKIGDTFQFLYYFTSNDASEEGRCWQRIPLFTPFPGNSAYALGTFFVVVNGTLYARTRYPRFENFLYSYDAVENRWNKLGHINSYENIWLVYAEPFLYSIDGRRDTRRYDLHERTWEVVQPVPSPYFYDVVVSTFMDKILVYGEDFDPEDMTCSIYKLQIYDPKEDKWMLGVCEKFPAGFNTDVKVPPLMLQHNGACYRVMFKRSVAQNYDPSMHGAGLPLVREFVFGTDDDGVLTVELGDEECQDLIPPNLCGAFRIADDVFVSWGSSFVLKTGLKAWEDKWDGDVDLGMWDYFKELEPSFSNVIMFTFNKDLLMEDDIIEAEGL